MASMNPKSEVSRKILMVVANLQNYLYRRIDTFGRPSAYHWKTSYDTKERMLNFYKDCFERGVSTVESEGLLEEMRAVVRDGGQLGAPGRGKDDRVIAAALAHIAWSDYTRNQCIQRGLIKPIAGAVEDAMENKQKHMSQEIKGYLQRLGVKV